MAIWLLIVLGAAGMLAVGIAVGGLISRADQFGLPTGSTGTAARSVRCGSGRATLVRCCGTAQNAYVRAQQAQADIPVVTHDDLRRPSVAPWLGLGLVGDCISPTSSLHLRGDHITAHVQLIINSAHRDLFVCCLLVFVCCCFVRCLSAAHQQAGATRWPSRTFTFCLPLPGGTPKILRSIGWG